MITDDVFSWVLSILFDSVCRIQRERLKKFYKGGPLTFLFLSLCSFPARSFRCSILPGPLPGAVWAALTVAWLATSLPGGELA